MTSLDTQLGPEQRRQDLQRVATDVFDVLVVGGGITGAGAALDAASRGLSVAVIEADDFGSGTSSRSSKLIHGGLRYLEMLDFRLVREALAERRRLLRTIAPHLVRPVRFVWPLRHRVWERTYLSAGLTLYDLMAGQRAVPRHRHLSRSQVRQLAPSIDSAGLVGGVSFYDANVDDARMVMTVLRTARGQGAAIVSYARANASRWEGGLRVTEVSLEDGSAISVRSRHVCYATGPFTDRQNAVTSLEMRPSKGVHILVQGDRIAGDCGILHRTQNGILFIIPWLDHWLIGDTDTEWPHDRGTPVAHGGDVEGLLARANNVLARALTLDDVVGTFAGLRPLVQTDPASDTAQLSREHVVDCPEPGVSVIAGGKYTTYRAMARDLIDVAVATSGLSAGPCVTADLPLLGAEGYRHRAGQLTRALRQAGLDEAVVSHLVRRHGTDVDVLMREAQRHGLDHSVPGYHPYLWAEIRYAFSHEGARSIAAVLERRTRIKIQFRDCGREIVDRVADLGVEVLGWTDDEREAQIVRYLAVLDAEAAALATDCDEEALAAYRQ